MKRGKILNQLIVFSFLIAITLIFSVQIIQASGVQAAGFSSGGNIRESNGSPQDFPGKIVKAYRIARVSTYGYFYVEDQVKFQNDMGIPIQEFYFCLNQSNFDQLFEIYAKDKSGSALELSRENYVLNGFYVFKIIFSAPVMPGDEIEFTIWQFFRDKLDTNVTSEDVYVTLYHSTFIITPYYSDTSKCDVKLPIGSNIISYLPQDGKKGPNSITYTIENNAPFYSPLLYVYYNNSNTYYVEVESSVRELIISPNSDLIFKDHLVIKNNGLVNISTLTFTVPGDARNFTAHDWIGNIGGITDPTEPTEEEFGSEERTVPDYKNVTLNLMANRYQITFGRRLDLTFEFRLPRENRVSTGDYGNIVILDVYRICNYLWLARDVKIKIGLPQAISIDFTALKALPDEVVYENGNQYLIYIEEYMAPFSSKPVLIKFTYSLVDMQKRALLIAMIVGLVCTFVISIRKAMFKFKRPGVKIRAEIPEEELKEFTEIFSEKIAIFQEIELLNLSFKRRKIKKREYTMRLLDFNKKLKNLEDSIQLSKSKLIEFGGRFKELIEELDVLEAERQSVQDALLGLEKRYKEGKIRSRIAYERSYNQYSSRLKKIKSSIDSGIMELKSYYV
ncbi:MAG: hypothetical protein ACTSWN_05045 [Promethearchaeota archaeon]